MRPLPPTKSIGTGIAAIILMQAASFAATLQYDDIAALKGMLPRKTETYEIVPQVELKGNYYHFKVKCDHADYEVESIKNLMKVCHEIRMMEEYKSTDEGGEVWKGLSGSVKNLGQGAKAIVTNPNRARKAIGRSLSKMGRKIGRLFKRKEDENGSNGKDRDEAAGGKYYGKTARTLAFNLKMDVYTDNLYARELLHAAAKREAMGKLVISGALIASPVPGLYVTLYGAMTPDSVDGQTERLIRDNLPDELRFQIARTYAQANDLDKKGDQKQIEAYADFLENPNFNPREVAYIANTLRQLSGAKNVKAAIAQLGEIDSVAEAIFIAGQYELLGTLNKWNSKITRLIPMGARIAAVNESGELVVPTSLDVAPNTAEMKAFRNAIIAVKESNRAANAKLFTIGPADPEFANGCAKAGLLVVGNSLQRSEFKVPAKSAR